VENTADAEDVLEAEELKSHEHKSCDRLL
jgi:hypothetical protein